jgi:pimeloyl-ACP methyl ester carboxylesterase
MISVLLSGDQFAGSLAESTFATPVPQSEIDAYASIFDYQDGTDIQHEVIEYLNERSENEVNWLETLGESDIPTTPIWGEMDDIAPLAVPDYVWTNYLEDREAPATYWRIPCADHYLQVDTPDLIEDILRATLANESLPYSFEGQRCSASLVDTNE